MFRVNIITNKSVLFEGLAESVFLPGEYGEFEILSFHAPIVSTLKKGKIRVDDIFLEIEGGVARMTENNELIVLAK